VERKIGTSAFSHLSIDAVHWRNADWARRKGLFAELHNTTEEMDESIQRLADILSHSNPDAMTEMKKIFWKGTEHWDHLLIERAKISGRLILSEFTKNALEKFKGK
jgi:methylglutaconyl-CoA hydratase